MVNSKNIFKLSALGLAATGSCQKTQDTTIQWGECDPVDGVKFLDTMQCGNLTVPFDYTTPDDGNTVTLRVIKAPARKQPSKGSIMLNYGGPGEVNRNALNRTLDLVFPQTGNEYDLVTFDTRGTGDTLPFNCYVNDGEAAYSAAQLRFGNESSVQMGKLWVSGGWTSFLCDNRLNATGSVLSTAFVARDMMRIVDGLGDEDNLLRFWGQSYGTTLGVTVAAMFPEKIDKLILDGVQNPHEYYHSPATYEQWSTADAHFSEFFRHCVLVGPKACPLAAMNATAEQLEAATWNLLESLKSEPALVSLPGGLGVTVTDYTSVKSSIFNAFYVPSDPTGWASLATSLFALLSSAQQGITSPPIQPVDQTLTTSLVAGSREAQTLAMAQTGIQCIDNQVRLDSVEDMFPVLEEGLRQSRIFGDNVMSLHSTCARWSIRPAEVYEGGFDDLYISGGSDDSSYPTAEEKGNKPVLVLANTYDAHTSIRSARNITETFSGAVMLETEGYGHASLANPSLCAARRIRDYWTEGKVPEVGTVCESEAKEPFEGVSWDDILGDI